MSILRYWYLSLVLVLQSCGSIAYAQMLPTLPLDVPAPHGMYYYVHQGYMPTTITYGDSLLPKEPKRVDVVLVSSQGDTVICHGNIGQALALYHCDVKD